MTRLHKLVGKWWAWSLRAQVDLTAQWMDEVSHLQAKTLSYWSKTTEDVARFTVAQIRSAGDVQAAVREGRDHRRPTIIAAQKAKS